MKDSRQSTLCSRFYKKVSSSNNKEDIIKANLKEFAIALQVISGHPEVMNEFKTALAAASRQAPAEDTSNVQDFLCTSSY